MNNHFQPMMPTHGINPPDSQQSVDQRRFEKIKTCENLLRSANEDTLTAVIKLLESSAGWDKARVAKKSGNKPKVYAYFVHLMANPVNMNAFINDVKMNFMSGGKQAFVLSGFDPNYPKQIVPIKFMRLTMQNAFLGDERISNSIIYTREDIRKL